MQDHLRNLRQRCSGCDMFLARDDRPLGLCWTCFTERPSTAKSEANRKLAIMMQPIPIDVEMLTDPRRRSVSYRDCLSVDALQNLFRLDKLRAPGCQCCGRQKIHYCECDR